MPGWSSILCFALLSGSGIYIWAALCWRLIALTLSTFHFLSMGVTLCMHPFSAFLELPYGYGVISFLHFAIGAVYACPTRIHAETIIIIIILIIMILIS